MLLMRWNVKNGMPCFTFEMCREYVEFGNGTQEVAYLCVKFKFSAAISFTPRKRGSGLNYPRPVTLLPLRVLLENMLTAKLDSTDRKLVITDQT